MAHWATRAHECLLRQGIGAGLSEPALARALVPLLPDRSVLVLGNSLPVRDLDLFGGRTEREVTVLHQRGLSGIDGTIAGALGARSVTPASDAVVALLGDVSALHDIGSLALAQSTIGALVLIVVNNGGGQIFRELPLAQAIPEEALERLFVQPPALSFEHAARAFSRPLRARRARGNVRSRAPRRTVV